MTFAALVAYPLLLLRIANPVGSFPRPLTAAEERECVERAARGDEEARAKLIEHNLRLVAHIIKKYYTRTRDQDDLISIGTIGLIKGISTYRPDKGVRLATYASRCIENAILSLRPLSCGESSFRAFGETGLRPAGLAPEGAGEPFKELSFLRRWEGQGGDL